MKTVLFCFDFSLSCYSQRTSSHGIQAQFRFEKLRDSCYCDCHAKRSRKVNLPRLNRKGEIEYEEDDDDEEMSRHFEPSTDDDESDSTNGCPCVCHGMYSNQIQLNEVAEKKNRFDLLFDFFFAKTRLGKVLKL